MTHIYLLFITLAFLTLISQNLFLINEETLVALAFILFVIWIRQTQSQTLNNSIQYAKIDIQNNLLKEVTLNNNQLNDIKNKMQQDLTFFNTIENIFNNLDPKLSLTNDITEPQFNHLKLVDAYQSSIGFPIQTEPKSLNLHNIPQFKPKLLSSFFVV